ncbi:sensor histidine kinase [Sinorhizobium sp. Sb3]|uniref:sensor histidine kinase n=1 Tax=Sinorhizobium/Ensifer group TaxID=227292 RepID=UPI000AF2760B|nr:PAS domain S-box protein [Sinorhizobium sp. Sb3]
MKPGSDGASSNERDAPLGDACDAASSKSLPDLEPTQFVARTLFEHSPVPMIMVDAAGAIEHINKASEEFFGYPKKLLIGQPVEALVPSDKRLHHEQLRQDYMAHPVSRPMAEGRRLVACKKDGTEVTVHIAMNPVVLETSEVAVILTVIDISARELAERTEFFVKELTHRARNVFAIICAISRQLGKHSDSVSNFQDALEDRLEALSASYRVFEKERWQAAPVRDLVQSQIAFLTTEGMSQIDIQGPEICLEPAPAEYLGMAVHELATNAVKHGALSVPTGIVDVRWSFDPRAQLFEFQWTERNGPAAQPPERQGFGSVILKSIVPAAFGGTADLIVAPKGVSWTLKAPLATGVIQK